MLNKQEKNVIIFHVSLINSVDHYAPIITNFLKNYKHLQIIVYDIKNHKYDFRIQYFLKFERFKYVKETKFNFYRRRIIHNNFLLKILRNNSSLIHIYRFFLLFIFKNFHISKRIACCIYDWGPPYRANHTDAILSDIPTIVLPHGTATTRELAVTKAQNEPNFSNRNIFDLYIFKTNDHRLQFTKVGLSPTTSKVWGDPRFSQKWCDELLTITPKYQSRFNNNYINCLFFVVPLHYGTNEDQFAKLIESFSKVKEMNFIISIREDMVKELGIQILDVQNKNLSFDFVTSPSALIEWSDIVLDMGSSITIEAIIRKKACYRT